MTKAADLPQFQYRIDGKTEELLKPGEAWERFQTQLKQDHEKLLRDYEITDNALHRQVLNALGFTEISNGNLDAASGYFQRVQDLQEKPSAKLTGTLLQGMLIAAGKASPTLQSPEARHAAFQFLSDSLSKMPFSVVENDIKQMKANLEIFSAALAIGQAREIFDPIVAKTGGLSSDFARSVPILFVYLRDVLPLRDSAVEAIASYISANQKPKHDIWKARNVDLAPGKSYEEVRVAVWDSGVDLSLFPANSVQDAIIAFDLFAQPTAGPLDVLDEKRQKEWPETRKRMKAFSDLQSGIDSADASALKKELASLKPDEFKPFVETLNFFGNYSHGTHVAGIVLSGNPYARLVVGRITFEHKLQPDPCPSLALAERSVGAIEATIRFFQERKVRVVNMSWGGGIKEYENLLEKCGTGASLEERKALARQMFDLEKNALERTMRDSPEILYVAAAGNTNANSDFQELYPSSIRLPNLLTVGAVDIAGEEASFTSYGPTVLVHANGYQVESFVPGGERIAISGTSMASPQVANLAAKMLAVNPKLTPSEVITRIRETAEPSSDGRRMLIDPKKALGY